MTNQFPEMTYSDELEKSMERLQRLKANVLQRKIRHYVAGLRYHWKPRTKVEVYEGAHGSRKGDQIEVTEYWDVYRGNWTDKRTAFQGYVLWKVKQAMNKK